MKGQTGEGALGEEEANKAYEEERQVRLGSAGEDKDEGEQEAWRWR